MATFLVSHPFVPPCILHQHAFCINLSLGSRAFHRPSAYQPDLRRFNTMAKVATAGKMTHTEFREWRKKREMTQQQAADFLHLSIATIRAYEANPRRNEKARKVPEYMRRYLEALHAEEKLKTLRAGLRRKGIKEADLTE